MNPTPPPLPVSVLDPISPAIERAREILFRPFDLMRWLAIGFSAWLASLGDATGGGGGWGGNRNNGPGGSPSFNELWNEGAKYVTDNLGWLLWVAPLVVGLGIILALAITFLSSRGRFMFLHNVATGRADVVAPWNDFGPHANSLFLFRVALGLASLMTLLPFAAAAGWATVSMMRQEMVAAVPMLTALAGFGVCLVLGLTFVVIEKFTADFVVPIMYLRTRSCRAAWGEFGSLLRAHPIPFLLYLVFYVALDFVVAIVILLCLVICCVACCVLTIPYLGTVLMLPFFVFLRSYSALYLAQFGPDYDIFRRA